MLALIVSPSKLRPSGSLRQTKIEFLPLRNFLLWALKAIRKQSQMKNNGSNRLAIIVWFKSFLFGTLSVELFAKSNFASWTSGANWMLSFECSDQLIPFFASSDSICPAIVRWLSTSWCRDHSKLKEFFDFHTQSQKHLSRVKVSQTLIDNLLFALPYILPYRTALAKSFPEHKPATRF